MKVVCDTSPICYLLLIDQIEVLPYQPRQPTILPPYTYHLLS